MFTRNENENLVFENFNFSMFVIHAIEQAKPRNMREVEWMIEQMEDELKQCMQDYLYQLHKTGTLFTDKSEENK